MDFTIQAYCAKCGQQKECIILVGSVACAATCIDCCGVKNITANDLVGYPTIDENHIYAKPKTPDLWETWDGVDIWGSPVKTPNR